MQNDTRWELRDQVNIYSINNSIYIVTISIIVILTIVLIMFTGKALDVRLPNIKHLVNECLKIRKTNNQL